MHRRLTGSVKWFHAVNGLGVIRADDGSGDYFVARSAILILGRATLQEGERVTFEPVVEGLAFWAFNVIRSA
ncbi:MAG: cold shock domain-containing protein [Candidatus Pseudomonas phytovorans]|uniref:Cold shock domain-containing protein n=1 Tax=Candidatus Pseudomonas phytovorans TaxID=3121377 RepID=A0AAJ5WJE5_9PSED|nr:cold shock domain-containing protein [Pseudomonas sp.]WEK30737.1 MAG: cold shock domain-containing protein [Pseudomonas sp.]